MTLPQIIRTFTIVGILGSLVLIGGITYEYFDPEPIATNILEAVAMCIVFLGVISSYIVQAEHLGKFGLFSFIVLTVGYILSCGLNWAVAFVSPVYGELTPPNIVESAIPLFPLYQGMASTFIVLNVGMLLYGIAILRSGKVAKWAGLMFLAAVAGALAPPMDEKCIYFFCAGIIWIGIKGWHWNPAAQTAEPSSDIRQQKTVPYP
ncbi:hypothetical protein [Cohnella mopanensis]|uniref:hypothetical protein n=1 Tax=Cohnella mopanensis TaxID=2911966 RepID=UPI001EF86502|nr:hypothetical protein [Cohnella mopanensis]